MCPGKHLGDISLYSVVSSVLAVYNISAPVDEFGKPVQLQAEYKSGFLSYVFSPAYDDELGSWIRLFTYRSPVPFKCTIQPRTKVAESLIRGFSD